MPLRFVLSTANGTADCRYTYNIVKEQFEVKYQITPIFQPMSGSYEPFFNMVIKKDGYWRTYEPLSDGSLKEFEYTDTEQIKEHILSEHLRDGHVVVKAITTPINLLAGRIEPETIFVEWNIEPLEVYSTDGIDYHTAYHITLVGGYTLSNVQLQDFLVLYKDEKGEFQFNMDNHHGLSNDDLGVLYVLRQSILQHLFKH